MPDPLPPRPEPTAEPPAVDRYVLKPKPPAADDRKKARFDEWMREENEKRAAAAKEISDRALADVGADVEDVSLAVATQRHS